MADKQDLYLCVSYVPLLVGPPGVNVKEMKMEKAVLQLMKDANNIAEACIWIRHQNIPIPVMVIKDAKAIVDHLKYWSEGEPTEWFDLMIGTLEMDGQRGYTIILQPKLDKSGQRFKNALKQVSGIEIPDTAKIQVLSKPLMIRSNGDTYQTVKDGIGDTCYLGLVDPVDVNRELNGIEVDENMILGPFKVLPLPVAFNREAQA
jgi:hypothetical protein